MKKVLIDDQFKLELNIREKETHKGDYGKVLIVAGSKSMAGAAMLASLAAYRTGFSFVPEAILTSTS